MQSQGTKRQVSKEDEAAEREQLERSAEMFEMILQTAPDDVQNHLALKEIYRQLGRGGDFNRIAKRLAEVYLASGQREQAAGEYVELLEVDPNDEDVVKKLQEIGYTRADFPVLKAEANLNKIRRKYEQKKRELQESEEVFLKASARTRDARKGHDEESRRVLKAVEEKAEGKSRQLIEEHERWLKEGRAQLFKQVSENLKKKADRIIQANEFGSMRKSIKQAEKILASADGVVEEEWPRVRQERERDFQKKFEELKQDKEAQLHSAWEELVARAEQEQAAADQALRQIKGELQELETELTEKEKLLQGSKKAAAQEASPRVKDNDDSRPPEVVAAGPGLATSSDEPAEELVIEPAARKLAKDEVGKTLGAILVQHGLVTRQHLEEAIAKQKEDHRPVGQILVESGYATEEDIINALIAQAGVPYLPLANYEISDDVAMTIPRELAFKYALMPVDSIGGNLLVSMGIPLTKEQKRELQQHLQGMKITYFISSWSDIKVKHEQHYG